MLKLFRTPLIFIDWLSYRKSFRGGLIDIPEFTQYWRLHR